MAKEKKPKDAAAPSAEPDKAPAGTPAPADAAPASAGHAPGGEAAAP
ncbi:MAG: hypothetical protein JWO38_2224, partial [Gemmataceae bacterium]|nr:hypothetical protein [Gemmataceae bacterium]